jgi:hypothetical protein
MKTLLEILKMKNRTYFYETLIECIRPTCDDSEDGDVSELNYSYYYIVEAINKEKAIKKVKQFVSNYFTDEWSGEEIGLFKYKYLNGETIEMISIKKTSPTKFIKNRIGDMFLIK